MDVSGGIGGDEWDQIPDDELEETVAERLIGLTEMFSESFRHRVEKSFELAKWGTVASFGLMRSALWIASTTFIVCFLPYVIEKERAEFEKSQSEYDENGEYSSNETPTYDSSLSEILAMAP